MTPNIGLYYPHVHFRDEAWLKMAALYWPHMSRIVPYGYPMHDSETVQALSEDFIINISPDFETVYDVAGRFLHLILEHRHELEFLYRIGSRPVDNESLPGLHESPLAKIYVAKMGYALGSELEACGLARERGEWLDVHPQLAWVYMCALAEEIAGRNSLHPVTHEDVAHAATSQWTLDKLVSVLLHPEHAMTTRPRRDIADAVGLLAVQLVVPRDITKVPAEKLVEIRKRYGADFIAFREAVDESAQNIAEQFADIHEREIFDRYLNQEIARRFAIPLGELRRALKGIRVDSGIAVANMRLELPAGAAALTSGWLIDKPLLGGAGAIAFGLVGLGREVRRQRDQAMKPSPSTYLLQVKRDLTPLSSFQRVAYLLKRIAQFPIS